MSSESTESEATGPDLDVLAEMAREAERVLDHQIQAAQELDDKSEEMIRLGVASLAGGVALAGFTATQFAQPINGPFLVLVGTGGTSNLASILLFLGSYIGFRRPTEIDVGPAPEWLGRHAKEAGWNLHVHYRSVLEAFSGFHDYNLQRMTASALSRRRGLYILALAVASHALAFIYILARSV